MVACSLTEVCIESPGRQDRTLRGDQLTALRENCTLERSHSKETHLRTGILLRNYTPRRSYSKKTIPQRHPLIRAVTSAVQDYQCRLPYDSVGLHA